MTKLMTARLITTQTVRRYNHKENIKQIKSSNAIIVRSALGISVI